MSLSHDILAELAEIKPGSPLAEARATRDAATRHAQGSYEILFTQQDSDFALDERFAVAAKVARWHNAEALAAHYAGFGLADPTSDRLTPALNFARLLTFSPVEATPTSLRALTQAGWSKEGIVTLAQLIAFVSFQSRLIAGLRLLNDRPVATSDAPVAAGVWHTTATTATGKAAPVAFTQQELGWEPWIAAKPLADFRDDEVAILAKFGHTDSDYFRLLGRNLPVLEQRTLTDKGIFYTPGGLPRAERKLAATVTSPGQSLSEGQSARWQAEINFAAALSVTPPAATPLHLAALEKEGLDTLAQLDLVQSAAFFAWANRLMLTLGEPWLA